MISDMGIAERATHAAIGPFREALDEIDERVAQVPPPKRYRIRRALGGGALVALGIAAYSGERCADNCEQVVTRIDPSSAVDALMGIGFAIGFGYMGYRLGRLSITSSCTQSGTHTVASVPQLSYEDYQDNSAS